MSQGPTPTFLSKGSTVADGGLLCRFQKKNAIPATAARPRREPTTAPTITPVLSSSSSESDCDDVVVVVVVIETMVGEVAPTRAGLLAMTVEMAFDSADEVKLLAEAVTAVNVIEEVAESTYTVKVTVTEERRPSVAFDSREFPVFSVQSPLTQFMIPIWSPYPYSVATFVAPVYADAPPWSVVVTSCVTVCTVAAVGSTVVGSATYTVVGAEVGATEPKIGQ